METESELRKENYEKNQWMKSGQTVFSSLSSKVFRQSCRSTMESGQTLAAATPIFLSFLSPTSPATPCQTNQRAAWSNHQNPLPKLAKLVGNHLKFVGGSTKVAAPAALHQTSPPSHPVTISGVLH